ncbi:MAG: universal stress protein [Nitrospirae bacterium]|uniref:universal stress protein n=1 Tax=Candidatus Magnetobacterium casense TaxID=1455061 RepID=UPI00058E368F|nr:universal stress protein [Candidatus Magnetobacterium casensis]MBF0336366.1 universal stress protein [Nitrospirota bacterium]
MSKIEGNKKVAVVVYPGLEYKKAIMYARETANEYSADLVVTAVMPDLRDSGNMMLAIGEYGNNAAVCNKIERDCYEFFDRVEQFCTENGIKADQRIEKGEIDEIITALQADTQNIRLIVVPAATKNVNYSVFFDSIKQFARKMLPSQEMRCPVVSVL